MNQDLTKGNALKVLILFALPYLISSFLQTFYGMADLYIVGQFNGSSTLSAVSIGSQVMHMITVVIIGLAMGITIRIGYAVGSRNNKKIPGIIGNGTIFFVFFTLIAAALLLWQVENIVSLMSTPVEAVNETVGYLRICFMGIPFIVIYNAVSSIFRGMGDSKSPLLFVFISCLSNIILDYCLVGIFSMGASGAAIATIIAQGICALTAFIWLKHTNKTFTMTRQDFALDKSTMKGILHSGCPIALQDGFIQISFLVITMIANSRGLVAAAAVGVVEKIISFLFLVPSAFLSALSALVAQNIGANQQKRADTMLRYALIICIAFACCCFVMCQLIPDVLVGLFSTDQDVITAGSEYIRTYSLDCIFAAVHFCFSGYLCGAGHSNISFIHNTISIICLRIPVAYLASRLFPSTLLPMGLAAPLGSLLSSIICIGYFIYLKKKDAALQAG